MSADARDAHDETEVHGARSGRDAHDEPEGRIEGRIEARIEALREEIASVDDALVELIGRRLAAAREIGALKQSLGRPVLDPAREAEVVRRAAERARGRDIDPEVVRAVLWRIIDSARDVQHG